MALKSEFHGSTKLWQLPVVGRWRKADAEPALAFIGTTLSGDPIVIVADCDCKAHLKCPLAKAFTFAADKLDVVAISAQRVKAATGVVKMSYRDAERTAAELLKAATKERSK